MLEKVAFDREELDEYMSAVGRNLFTHGLRDTLQQFSEVDNFGSLIVPKVASVSDVLAALDGKDMGGNLFLADTHQRVLKVLRMADYLSPRYAVVLANPPHMGGKGMNGRLSAWAKENYPDSKSDLFAMFIERGFDLTPKYGYSAMVTMQSWMFLSSYENLRQRILSEASIECMAHMANMVMGIALELQRSQFLKKVVAQRAGGLTATWSTRTSAMTISQSNFHREMSDVRPPSGIRQSND